jgi:hypothetical protein
MSGAESRLGSVVRRAEALAAAGPARAPWGAESTLASGAGLLRLRGTVRA